MAIEGISRAQEARVVLMCQCTPNIKTPFCGKPGCEWPTSTEVSEHPRERPEARHRRMCAKPFGQPWDEFERAGLNKPGTIVYIEESKYESGGVFIIGDININRGLCDDCEAFRSNAIVSSYDNSFVGVIEIEKENAG